MRTMPLKEVFAVLLEHSPEIAQRDTKSPLVCIHEALVWLLEGVARIVVLPAGIWLWASEASEPENLSFWLQATMPLVQMLCFVSLCGVL